MGNKTKWAIINDFILIFDPSLLLTIITLLTELVGIPELHYFLETFHWEVAQAQDNFSQKEVVSETYSTV